MASLTNVSSSEKTNEWLDRLMLKAPHKNFILRVNKEYIEDRFNLVDLPTSSSFSSNPAQLLQALEIIKGNLTTTSPSSSPINNEDINQEHNKNEDILEQYDSLCLEIYGLIHARFIITPHGIRMMDEKISSRIYGHCQRLYCREELLMPYGLSNFAKQATMLLYCAKCNELYRKYYSKSSRASLIALNNHKQQQNNKNNNNSSGSNSNANNFDTNDTKFDAFVDGAFFGRNFPQMYFMMYPRKRPKINRKLWQIIDKNNNNNNNNYNNNSDDDDDVSFYKNNQIKINSISNYDNFSSKNNRIQCTCDESLIIPGKNYRFVSFRINYNNLYYDSSEFPNLQTWFVALPGNKLFLNIPPDFIQINQAKALPRISELKNCNIMDANRFVYMLSGRAESNDNNRIHFNQNLFELLVKVYGIFHELYTATDEAISRIKTMWEKSIFGLCTRYHCSSIESRLFPITICAKFDHFAVKYYCFSCQNAFHNSLTKTRNIIDGAFFNIYLLYNFILKYPACLPNKRPQKYVPTLFEIKINPQVFSYEDEDDQDE